MIRPLIGLKIIEFEGIGPGPLAGRMLADQGAEVLAIVRPNKPGLDHLDLANADLPLRRGKRIVVLDLKRPEAVFKIIEQYYPSRMIPPRTKFLVEELLQDSP